MISKTDLRKQQLNKRKTLKTDILSKIICDKISKNEHYKKAKKIFAYYPKQYEVDITPLFKNKEKDWFLPKTKKEILKFYEYKYGEKLKKSEFGVYEPVNEKETSVMPDLIIVPALSVDKKNYRLGYGKGYYDRFLNKFEKIPYTITPIFSELIVEKLPTEKHDKKIDAIITEKNDET